MHCAEMGRGRRGVVHADPVTQPPPPPLGPPPSGPPPSAPGGPRAGSGRAIALIVGAVLIALVAAVVIVLLATRSDDDEAGRDQRKATPSDASPTEDASASGSASGSGGITDGQRADVLTFADDAATTILSYSYQSLDQHRTEATALMTDDFADEWSATVDSIEGQVAQSKTTVTAEPGGAALIGIDDDSAQVLVFGDQSATRAGTAASTIPYSAVLTLERDGDSWLVDDLATTDTPPGPAEPDAEREAAIDAASAMVDAFINVDYRTIDADTRKVLDLATGEFESQYSTGLDDLKKLTRQAKSVSTGKVTAAGIETFATDHATVLVAGTASITNNATNGRASARKDRLRLDLTRVDDAWLVSELEIVSP